MNLLIKILPFCVMDLSFFVSSFCEGAQQGSMDSPTGCFILKMACPMIKPSTIHANNSREYVMATNIAIYPNARLTPNNEIERKNKKQAFPLSSRLLPVHPNGHENDRNAIMDLKLFDLIFFLFLF